MLLDSKKIKQFTIKFRADERTLENLDIICDDYNLTRSQVLRRLIDIGIFNETVKTLLLNDEVELMEFMPRDSDNDQVRDILEYDDTKLIIEED